MQKVLILAYFFPPSNQVGGERPQAWANFLSENGFFPIIVTRQWNEGQVNLTDFVSNNVFQHEKYDTYEVYRLPYHFSLRDKLASFPALRILQRAFTLVEQILSNFFINALPFANFLQTARKVLQNDKDIACVIATGRPFTLFHIAHQLKKEFHIPYIADYRDEWNTYQQRRPANLGYRLLFALEKRSEKNWTSNADAFFSTSNYWVASIHSYIGKEGFTVMNGYKESAPPPLLPTTRLNNVLTLGYVGTLYPEQPIEAILEVCRELLNDHPKCLHLVFIGIEMVPGQTARIQRILKGFEKSYEILPRMLPSELLKVYSRIDIMCVTGFDGIKGWYPVKIFENFKNTNPMLLYPSDQDVIETFIEETKSGIVANTPKECKDQITQWIAMKTSGKEIVFPFDQEKGSKYSRRHQVSIMAGYLRQIIRKQ
jgi:glycosyltransferase involved in cell wall biosynthesis